MTDVFQLLEGIGVERCMLFSEPSSGLRAILVLDDITLGPAAGGVRTARYDSFSSALEDAFALARAMTHKCALAGLGAGGGKIVVLDHDDLDRGRAFEALGNHVESLEGLFRTSGDYGTTQDDLRAMARRTRYVQSDEVRIAHAVAIGVLRSVEALQQFRGHAPRVEGLRIAIQGCGATGAAVARLFAEHGAELVVSDLVAARAEGVAAETGADIIEPDDILHAEVDIFAPCARGGWLDVEKVNELAARAVCGAANNVLTGIDAARRLQARGILHVPDAISSAGAVVEGIGRTVMGLPDRSPLLDHLGRTALTVLRDARDKGITTHEAAEQVAKERLEKARERA
ncbi:MAG: Glu/Leu/Phe/Val dehydrogenase dimerization domain-containing protein [Myxococcota bacterium]